MASNSKSKPDPDLKEIQAWNKAIRDRMEKQRKAGKDADSKTKSDKAIR